MAKVHKCGGDDGLFQDFPVSTLIWTDAAEHALLSKIFEMEFDSIPRQSKQDCKFPSCDFWIFADGDKDFLGSFLGSRLFSCSAAWHVVFFSLKNHPKRTAGLLESRLGELFLFKPLDDIEDSTPSRLNIARIIKNTGN